ncbi:hypothetical protein PROFUN_11852 [Planoprotostelium fungivorum]|uniref:Uncharacterized protein n=1 Tax=Planoprotostelium fungivorum TaxID=1890364 RepID=A0A2P6N9C2_9EUKA|nr:hypothetical protein PROFUN_11852 [Planoprotostelium fungivorum]
MKSDLDNTTKSHATPTQQHNNMGGCSDVLLIILCIIFPPIGVLVMAGCGHDFVINLILTLLWSLLIRSTKRSRSHLFNLVVNSFNLKRDSRLVQQLCRQQNQGRVQTIVPKFLSK